MAAAPDDDKSSKFSSFMAEVKGIEKRDSVLTSDKQIDRLTKPGSKYLNLNPYEGIEARYLQAKSAERCFPMGSKFSCCYRVLQVSPEATEDEIKKAFRKLSILVHPDKNHDDRDRAQKAFEAVNHANNLLKDANEVKKVKHLLEEAEALIKKQLTDKRNEAKKLGRQSIEEDEDAEKYHKFRRAVTAKLFADYEIKRLQLEERSMQERKREREQEIAEEEKVKKQKEWQKKWDEGRNERVDSWRNFQTTGKGKSKGKKTKTKSFTPFKPPSLKPEQR